LYVNVHEHNPSQMMPKIKYVSHTFSQSLVFWLQLFGSNSVSGLFPVLNKLTGIKDKNNTHECKIVYHDIKIIHMSI
jgi:hypothetical protein